MGLVAIRVGKSLQGTLLSVEEGSLEKLALMLLSLSVCVCVCVCVHVRVCMCRREG